MAGGEGGAFFKGFFISSDRNPFRDFPGGPVAGTLTSTAVGDGVGWYEFDPWLGSWDSTCLMAKGPKSLEQKGYHGRFDERKKC